MRALVFCPSNITENRLIAMRLPEQPTNGRLVMPEKANGRKTNGDDLTKILRMRYETLLDYWTIKTTAARTAAQWLPRTT